MNKPVGTVTVSERFSSLFPHSLEYVGSLLSRLQTIVPMQLWMVTRTQGENWIVVKSCDRGYGVMNGDRFCWSDSFCSRMVRGLGPFIAPDASSIQAYQEAPIGLQVPIGAYIGVPLLRADHSLFGTLCAIDPEPQPRELENHLPLVQDIAGAISGLLRLAEYDEQDLRKREIARLDGDQDINGFFDARALSAYSVQEEQRLNELGMCSGVITIEVGAQRPRNIEPSQDKDWTLAVGIPMQIRQWATEHGCFISRITDQQYVLLVPGCDQAELDVQAGKLRDALGKLPLRCSVSWGVRDTRSNYQEIIRNCLARNRNIQGISSMQIAPH